MLSVRNFGNLDKVLSLMQDLLQVEPSKRPTIADVIKEIRKLLQLPFPDPRVSNLADLPLAASLTEKLIQRGKVDRETIIVVGNPICTTFYLFC